MMTSTYSPPPSRIIIGYNTQQQQQNQQAQQQASNGGAVTQVISSSSAPITSSSGQQQKTQTIYRTPSNFVYANQNYSETNGNGGEVKNHIFTQQQHSKQQLDQQNYGNGIDVGGGGGAQQQAEDELLRKNQVRILTYPPPGMDGSSAGGSQSGVTKLIVNGTSIPSTSMSSGGEVKMHELSSTIVYGAGGNGGATTQILVQNHSDSPAGAQQQYSVISPFQLQQQNGGGAADGNIEYLVLQDAGENGGSALQQQQQQIQLVEGGAPPVRKTRNLAAKRRRMDNETDEDRARRRARDAETKRARRQRETSEQRARRLSRDSQRMRRTRRIKRLLGPNATLSDLKKSGLTLEDLDAEPPRRRHIRYLKSEKNSKESTPDNEQMLYGSGDSVSTTPRFSTITTSGIGLGPSSSSSAAIVNGGNVGIIQSGNGSHPIILSQAGGPQQHQQQHEIHLNEIIGTPHNSGQQQQYTHSGGGPQTITYEQHSRLQQQHHHHHQSQHQQQQTSVATSVVPIMATTSAANGAPGGFVTLHVTLPPGVDPQQPQILHLPPSNSLHQHIIVQRPPPLPHQQQHHVQIHGGQHPHQQPQTIIYRTTTAPDEFGIDDYKDYKDFIHIQQPSGASVQIPSSSGTLIPNTHQIQLHHVQPPQHQQQQQPLPPHLQQQQHQLQLHSQQPPPQQQQHIIHQQQQQVVVPPPPPPTKRRRQRRGVLVNTNALAASGGVLQTPSVSMAPVVTAANVPQQRTPRQSAAYRPRAHPGFSGPTSISVGASGSNGEKTRLITSGKFEGLTEDQVLRRRRANAERSRRRRQLETPEQRRERNKRTAERMRARRARMAEERMMTRYSNGGGPPPSTRQIVPLSLDRFEEIFQSVILRCKDSEVVMSRNNRPIIRPKDDDGDLAVSGLQMLHYQGQILQQQEQQIMDQQQRHHQQQQRQMLVDEEDGIDLDAEEEELRQRQMCATPSYIEAEPYHSLRPPSSHQYQQPHGDTVASTADNNASTKEAEEYGMSSQESAFDSTGDDVDASTAGAAANNTTLSFSGGEEDRENASSSMLDKTGERMDELGESSGFNNTTEEDDAGDCSTSLNVDENTISPPLSIGDYSNTNGNGSAPTTITTTIPTTAAGPSMAGGRSAPTFIDDEEGPKNMVVVVGGEGNDDDDEDDDMDAMVNEMYRHREDGAVSAINRDGSVGAGENPADNEEGDPSSLVCLTRGSRGDETDGERRPANEAEEDNGGADGGEPSDGSNNNSGDSTTIVVDEGL